MLMKEASEEIQNLFCEEILNLEEKLTEVESELSEASAEFRMLQWSWRRWTWKSGRNLDAPRLVLS